VVARAARQVSAFEQDDTFGMDADEDFAGVANLDHNAVALFQFSERTPT
jgi:hypothetical protein